MSFTFSSNDEVDYAQLGMCPICAVRFTHGCEHSNTIESQQWLAAYIVAEELDSDSVAELVAEFTAHPVDEAQKIEREIDAMLDGRNEIEHAQIVATFGKVKVTTSPEWRKRHLHQTAEQVEAAKVQADMLKELRS